MLRPSNLKNVERGCQPNILCRLFSDESCSASCSKRLAWFISKVTSVYKVPMPMPDSNGGSENGSSSMLADVLIGLGPFVVVVSRY